MQHIDGSKLIDEDRMVKRCMEYAKDLEPWAIRFVARKLEMISATNRRSFMQAIQGDKSNFIQAGTSLFATVERGPGRLMSQALRSEAYGPIRKEMIKLQDAQVELIKSLPIEAGRRAQKLAREAMMDGKRAAEVAEELNRTEHVVLSRATLIARTETAKANSVFTQARAEELGITHYFWRGTLDAQTRESHREMIKRSMAGETFSYSDPPEVGDEGAHAPGEFPRCRCFSEPVISIRQH